MAVVNANRLYALSPNSHWNPHSQTQAYSKILHSHSRHSPNSNQFRVAHDISKPSTLALSLFCAHPSIPFLPSFRRRNPNWHHPQLQPPTVPPPLHVFIPSSNSLAKLKINIIYIKRTNAVIRAFARILAQSMSYWRDWCDWLCLRLTHIKNMHKHTTHTHSAYFCCVSVRSCERVSMFHAPPSWI